MALSEEGRLDVVEKWGGKGKKNEEGGVKVFIFKIGVIIYRIFYKG